MAPFAALRAYTAPVPGAAVPKTAVFATAKCSARHPPGHQAIHAAGLPEEHPPHAHALDRVRGSLRPPRTFAVKSC